MLARIMRLSGLIGGIFSAGAAPICAAISQISYLAAAHPLVYEKYWSLARAFAICIPMFAAVFLLSIGLRSLAARRSQ